MISTLNKTNQALPKLPLRPIVGAVLGSNYNLSLVVCGNALAKKLNQTWRAKDYPANVLSFPLSETEGEIFINLIKVKTEAKELGQTVRERFLHLFIHGLLHLKGMDHGSKMDEAEQGFLTVWTKPNEKHRDRPRHRDGGRKGRRGRSEAR